MAIAAISTGVSLLGNIGTRLRTPAQNEPRREAWADQMYAKAISGDKAALQALYDQAGLRNPGQFGGSAIGAGTEAARAYIKTKYDAAVAILRSTNNDVSITGGAGPNATVDSLGAKASQVSLTQLVVFGGIAWVVYAYVIKRG
jgi:hypothetical protein